MFNMNRGCPRFEGTPSREAIVRLFVIGATGRTGLEILQLALARGHTVTAFVRSPHKIAWNDPRVAVRKGAPTDADQLAEAMPDHDAVLSVLGPIHMFKPESLLHQSALATTRAMAR